MNHEKVNPLICPLCGSGNSCENLSAKDESKSCWCNDLTIKFSSELLSMVPSELKRKACICKACAINHQESIGVQIYKP